MKPRDQWDREDLLDYLDGWHEASDLGFKTSRDTARVVSWPDPDDVGRMFNMLGLPDALAQTLSHPAAALMAAGRTARERHREEHGI